MYKKIQEELINSSERLNKYNGKMPINIVPNVNEERFLNVRIPQLRAIAKDIAKSSNWLEYIRDNKNKYIEETTVEGLILGYLKIDEKEKLKYIKNFVDKIDNWITCDVVCSTLKFKDKKLLWDFIEPYSKEREEFKIRFFAIMALTHFKNIEYVERILKIFNSIETKDYYAQMGIAWTVSMFYVKFPIITASFLNSCELDDFTYNKALQKIIESNQVSKEDKDLVRSMKRKIKR